MRENRKREPQRENFAGFAEPIFVFCIFCIFIFLFTNQYIKEDDDFYPCLVCTVRFRLAQPPVSNVPVFSPLASAVFIAMRLINGAQEIRDLCTATADIISRKYKNERPATFDDCQLQWGDFLRDLYRNRTVICVSYTAKPLLVSRSLIIIFRQLIRSRRARYNVR